MYEIIIAVLLGCAVWLPIYKYYISRLVGNHVVSRIESKDIDLNHLLDHGGVFDALADRVVTLFKQHMLAEMGQLSRASKGSMEDMDPMSMGLEASEELLKMVGMKKPPAILQYKVAQALGELASRNANTSPFEDFPP